VATDAEDLLDRSHYHELKVKIYEDVHVNSPCPIFVNKFLSYSFNYVQQCMISREGLII
jgi:hypothetical protein